MSTSMSPTRRYEAATALWPFFVQEFLRIMRGRLARLILALMIYSLIMVPFIMEKPPAELLQALASWLGPSEIQTKLILFVWIDASMNKFAVILGPVLARGIIVDERSRRVARCAYGKANSRSRLFHSQACSFERCVRVILFVWRRRSALHFFLASEGLCCV
jgi:ABC-type transport system involved in multi-copper enzyme maturation permease subunit